MTQAQLIKKYMFIFSMFLYYDNICKVMVKNYVYNKATLLGLFMFATAIFSFIGFNDIYAQSTTGNQSSASTNGGNQSSSSANQTETLGTLANLTGSDQSIISKDQSISNPNNTLGNSLATNEFQSY